MKIISFHDSPNREHWIGEISRSDWRAGAFLAKLLTDGTFYTTLGEGSRVLLLTRGDELVSYCTYAKWDDIQPTDLTPWVGFVYTFPQHRGHRHAGLLFDEVERLARQEGVSEVYLSTNHVGLYEKYGFEFKTVMNDTDGQPSRVYVRKIAQFRELVRKKQQLSRDECIGILKTELRGVLSVIGDGGYPYGVPINHYYCEDDGKIYFHGGKTGHKIDGLRRCGKSSFCVYDSGSRRDGEWALNIKSVIVFGRVEFIEDRETVCRISEQLSRKFTDDEEYIRNEIKHFADNTLMFALTPEHITGKLVNES